MPPDTQTDTVTCATCGKELDPTANSAWPSAAWFDVLRDNAAYCRQHAATGREFNVGDQRVLVMVGRVMRDRGMSTPETEAPPSVEDALDRTLGIDTSEHRTGTDAPAEAPESGADTESITVAGQTYANIEEFKKAHEELRTHLSQTRPVEPEPEPEYVDPWASVPGVDPTETAKLHAWALEDPLAAGVWAWENREELPQKIATDIINHAISQNPAGWDIYRHDQYQTLAAQMAEQQVSGVRAQQIEGVAASAENTVKAKYGAEEYQKYEARIMEKIQAEDYVKPRGGFPNGIPTETALVAIVDRIYRDLWLEDHFDEINKPAAQPSPQAAATQTRSQTAGPADDVTDAINRRLGLA